MDNRMFCFQCEQTAGCAGCTGKAGVCGKTAEVAELQDQLTGALVGLCLLYTSAAALRAAGTADPCSLYGRGLRVVPPDARRGRGVFFIGWISPTAQKQEDTTLHDRNIRGIGIALCLLTLLLSLSGCGSLKIEG